MIRTRDTAKTSISLVLLLTCTSCATKGFLKVENQDKVLKIDAYDKKLKVIEIAQPSPAPVQGAQATASPEPEITKIEKVNPKKNKIAKEEKVKIPIKEPELEDKEGYLGRRPVIDPFVVGEKTTLKLSYFNVVAGELDMEVRPYVEVNGRKAYHFFMTVHSNSLFSKFYSVDDSAETFLDYEQLIPYNMAVHVQETKQLRELRALFDWKKMKADFWEKKVTAESGVEEKTKTWAIPAFSQNVISAAYYLRTFTLRPDKEIKFRLADEQKNMVATAKVLRREKLHTDIGELDTLVLQPEIAIEGVFQPMGEVMFWVTDDNRKFIVRIESKIKIGKIIAQLKSLQR